MSGRTLHADEMKIIVDIDFFAFLTGFVGVLAGFTLRKRLVVKFLHSRRNDGKPQAPAFPERVIADEFHRFWNDDFRQLFTTAERPCFDALQTVGKLHLFEIRRVLKQPFLYHSELFRQPDLFETRLLKRAFADGFHVVRQYEGLYLPRVGAGKRPFSDIHRKTRQPRGNGHIEDSFLAHFLIFVGQGKSCQIRLSVGDDHVEAVAFLGFDVNALRQIHFDRRRLAALTAPADGGQRVHKARNADVLAAFYIGIIAPVQRHADDAASAPECLRQFLPDDVGRKPRLCREKQDKHLTARDMPRNLHIKYRVVGNALIVPHIVSRQEQFFDDRIHLRRILV